MLLPCFLCTFTYLPAFFDRLDFRFAFSRKYWLAAFVNCSWDTICTLTMNLGSDRNVCAACMMIILQTHCKLACCLCSEAVLAECNNGAPIIWEAPQNVAILTCCEIHTTYQQFTSAEYVCSTLSSSIACQASCLNRRSKLCYMSLDCTFVTP